MFSVAAVHRRRRLSPGPWVCVRPAADTSAGPVPWKYHEVAQRFHGFGSRPVQRRVKRDSERIRSCYRRQQRQRESLK